MKKILLLILLACLISACSSKMKPDYRVTEASAEKKPAWMNDLKKYEKKKGNEGNEYKYFVSESNSIEKRLCEQSAKTNANIAIAAEIATEIDNLYEGVTEVQAEDMITINSKREQTNRTIKNRLSGIEMQENYWEKRSYSTELGAKQDKVSYQCYQLSRVKKSNHDKIISETINQQLNDIKNKQSKQQIKEAVEGNAEKANIDLEM